MASNAIEAAVRASPRRVNEMRQFRDSFARRLYLHTKLSNPHYPPEIQAETTLINFTVTQAGLSDQLNVLVLGKERADLSEMSEVLVKQQTGFKIKMGELEDEILDRLANAEGDITEDVELIEGLEETKRISTDPCGHQISGVSRRRRDLRDGVEVPRHRRDAFLASRRVRAVASLSRHRGHLRGPNSDTTSERYTRPYPESSTSLRPRETPD